MVVLQTSRGGTRNGFGKGREAGEGRSVDLRQEYIRNTYLEELHAGTTPSTRAGDYSDVKLVSPYGEIPWRDLSRISDAEMKTLMKEVVDKLFAAFGRLDDEAFLAALVRRGELQTEWDEPSPRPR